MGNQRMVLIAAAVVVALGGLGQATFVLAEQGKEMPAAEMKPQGKKGALSTAGRLARMTERLNLSEAQQAQIKPLLEDGDKQIKALREDSSLSRDQQRDKARAIMEATFAKIRPILTPEQQKKQDEFREKAQKNRLMERRPPVPEGSTPR